MPFIPVGKSRVPDKDYIWPLLNYTINSQGKEDMAANPENLD